MQLPTKEERAAILAQRYAEQDARSRSYVVGRFRIPTDEYRWYNSGVCYNTVGVKTRAAAEAIAAQVKDQTCNGGRFDGDTLGRIEPDGDGWSVTC